MFEQTFKNIDDILHKDAGCSSELDYVKQTSWVLFLKYLDDLEKDRRTKAELAGKKYEDLIAPEYKWEVWVAPKNGDGKLDHHKAFTGDDLKDFVDHKLFPYLKKFKTDAASANTIEYKIGEIFSELKNKIQSGYTLREVINRIDELRFRTHAEKHEMSHLYESKIQNMGNAGRNGGEYYTPRPLIKTIVKVVAPEIGNKIYDGAAGSAGFLVEAFEYLKEKHKTRSTAQDKLLQTETFFGKEKKSLAYIIGIMNMILHGNAKELFESVKSQIFQNLEDAEGKVLLPYVCNEIFAGGDAPKGNFSNEKNEKYSIPIIANAVKDNGLYGFTDLSRVNEPSITIAARGSGTGHTEIRYEPFFPIVRLIVLTPNNEMITLEFLKYSIQNLDILSSGSAIPQLTVPMIKEYSIPLPSIPEQQTIVQKLDALSTETKKLEAIYQQKINNLEELKKSILQKAFSGSLNYDSSDLCDYNEKSNNGNNKL